jgi:hypothetical protein
LLGAAKLWVSDKAREPRIERDGAPSRHAGRLKWAANTVRACDALRNELLSSQTGAAVLACVDAGVTKGWKACLQAEQRELVRLRSTPQAKEAIAAFFAKSKK